MSYWVLLFASLLFTMRGVASPETFSLESLAARYDGFLLDAYGVFWGSSEVGVLPGAAEAMAYLVSQGKYVGILSNSSQLAAKEKEKVKRYGLYEGVHYHFFLTSGEVAKELFSQESLPFPTPRHTYWLFGTPHPRAGSQQMFEGTKYRETKDLEEADFIHISVPHIDGVDQEDPEVFRDSVAAALSGIPVLCVNPDRFANEGSPPRPVVRQGSIAAMFAEQGASVYWMGKPFNMIYEAALAKFPQEISRNKILMIGDTPETDIRGAHGVGLDAALVTKTGVMTAPFEKEGLAPVIERLPESDKPEFLLERLCKEEFFIDHASVAVYAIDSHTGKVLFEKNSDLSLVPCSCMKVVTAAAALHILGAKSRFETHLEYSGTIDSAKILHGNLYIRGGGDPCLGSDRIPGTLSWKRQIEAWADAVQEIGIYGIEGQVIGDATRWEKALAVPSWSWEDLGNYYGAGACALSFHENCYSLVFRPSDKVGEPASILRTDPPIPMSVLQNEVKTGPAGSGDSAWIFGSEFSPLQFIRGTIPAAVSEFTIRGAIPDPATYAAALLSLELQARGIWTKSREMPQGERVSFHVTKSPTVGEIVYWTLQKSINLYAEHLLKKMGEVVYNEGSTDAGVKAVTDFWQTQKIDLSGFHMVDGSGNSRKNLVTATQLVQILLKMKESPLFSLFFDSLTEPQGSVRAKHGSMSLNKGWAGYAGDIVFAILVNQCTNPKVMNEKLGSFLLSLDQFNKK
jgi:PBP4 family serine-type D-alanyl-D-alanine carboxypeptidase